MNLTSILATTKEAMFLVLILSLPPIIVASVLGVMVSLLQAVTQVQESTLSFAVKLLGVTVTLALTIGWLGGELLLYANAMFDQIMRVGVWR